MWLEMLMRFYDTVIKKRRSWAYYEEMRRFKTGSREMTQARLAHILRHAARTVPFYKGLIDPEITTEGVFDVLASLPIITKKDLNTQLDLFKSSEPGKGVYQNSTGGSTGEPLRILQDGTYSDWMTGAKYLFYNWAGWEEGCRILKIWGSQRDVLGQTETLKAKTSSKLRNVKVLDAYQISPDDVKRYLYEIESYKPSVLECYVDSAYVVAREVMLRKINLMHRVNGVLVSAGSLYPEVESVISKAFHAPVVNRYGCREAGDIACTCPNGHIHVNPFTHFVEILDKNDKTLEEGTGRVILTLLTNQTMPLIRYEIGDLATVSKREKLCRCGRDWQTLDRVDGRESGVFYKKDGTIISPLFFAMTIGVYYNNGLFKQYQIVQEDYDRITIKLVLMEGLQQPIKKTVQDSLDRIKSDFIEALGKEIKVDFVFEKAIDPLPSGKYLYALSKVIPEEMNKEFYPQF